MWGRWGDRVVVLDGLFELGFGVAALLVEARPVRVGVHEGHHISRYSSRITSVITTAIPALSATPVGTRYVQRP